MASRMNTATSDHPMAPGPRGCAALLGGVAVVGVTFFSWGLSSPDAGVGFDVIPPSPRLFDADRGSLPRNDGHGGALGGAAPRPQSHRGGSCPPRRGRDVD